MEREKLIQELEEKKKEDEDIRNKMVDQQKSI